MTKTSFDVPLGAEGFLAFIESKGNFNIRINLRKADKRFGLEYGLQTARSRMSSCITAIAMKELLFQDLAGEQASTGYARPYLDRMTADY